MKIKIISDGTVHGTRVVNAETGERIEGITSVDWSMSANDGRHAVADLRVACVPVEITGDARVETIPIESLISE